MLQLFKHGIDRQCLLVCAADDPSPCGVACCLLLPSTRHALQISDLPARELVPGDVVELATGDKVPADLRLVQCRTATLRAEQASLTGEPQAVLKSTEPVGDAQCELQVGPGVLQGRGMRSVQAGAAEHLSWGAGRGMQLLCPGVAAPFFKVVMWQNDQAQRLGRCTMAMSM
jgi:hypothetical protein